MEWRTIPEFPRYEVSSIGEIRWADTEELLTEHYNATRNAYGYHMYHSDGRFTTRSYKALMYSAFPEFLTDWKAVPGYPKYMMNKQGEFLSTKTWEKLNPLKTPGRARLVNAKGKRVTVSIADLLFDTYGIFEPLTR